ncbi:putative histidine kinase HHK6p [Macrophomina phaseolina MS6]|uniref:Putative histidine kinase HHK6p n=1 Tax=Macrophomina phaseolina (strain MS6) TaxID=1126212 RepID=K2SC97_MACPH|nr:putative histidine kinase HHK6p [Macrophomina phaseolina MS6]
MRSSTGRIIRWLGTCTDIHDQVEALKEATKLRDQLKKVVECANVSLSVIDRNRCVSFHEGDFPPQQHGGEDATLGKSISEAYRECINGRSIHDVESALEKMWEGLCGPMTIDVTTADGREYYTLKLVPITEDAEGRTQRTGAIHQVILVSMNVTGMTRPVASFLEKTLKHTVRRPKASPGAQTKGGGTRSLHGHGQSCRGS